MLGGRTVHHPLANCL